MTQPRATLVSLDAPPGITSLLSHLGGPQPQRHLGIGRIVFSTAEEIGQGFALEQAQLHQAQDGLDAHGRT